MDAGRDDRGPRTKSVKPGGSDSGRASNVSPQNQPGATRVRTVSGFTVLVVAGAHERNAIAIADHQRGRINREQLLAAGWTPGLMRAAARRGWLRRVAWGVYVVGADTRPPLARETEVLLDAGPGVALSRVSVLIALNLTFPRPVSRSTSPRRRAGGARAAPESSSTPTTTSSRRTSGSARACR